MTAFSARDWDAENEALLRGEPPRPCPRCGRSGFYGPRRASPEEKYRACTFCGLWQVAGGEEATATPWAHGCDPWPRVAGAPLVEWAPPGAVTASCPTCGARVRVAKNRVTSPADDREHPWWRVPQEMSAVDSLVFWRAQLESQLPLFSRLYL